MPGGNQQYVSTLETNNETYNDRFNTFDSEDESDFDEYVLTDSDTDSDNDDDMFNTYDSEDESDFDEYELTNSDTDSEEEEDEVTISNPNQIVEEIPPTNEGALEPRDEEQPLLRQKSSNWGSIHDGIKSAQQGWSKATGCFRAITRKIQNGFAAVGRCWKATKQCFTDTRQKCDPPILRLIWFGLITFSKLSASAGLTNFAMRQAVVNIFIPVAQSYFKMTVSPELAFFLQEGIPWIATVCDVILNLLTRAPSAWNEIVKNGSQTVTPFHDEANYPKAKAVAKVFTIFTVIFSFLGNTLGINTLTYNLLRNITPEHSHLIAKIAGPLFGSLTAFNRITYNYPKDKKRLLELTEWLTHPAQWCRGVKWSSFLKHLPIYLVGIWGFSGLQSQNYFFTKHATRDFANKYFPFFLRLFGTDKISANSPAILAITVISLIPYCTLQFSGYFGELTNNLTQKTTCCITVRSSQHMAHKLIATLPMAGVYTSLILGGGLGTLQSILDTGLLQKLIQNPTAVWCVSATQSASTTLLYYAYNATHADKSLMKMLTGQRPPGPQQSIGLWGETYSERDPDQESPQGKKFPFFQSNSHSDESDDEEMALLQPKVDQ